MTIEANDSDSFLEIVNDTNTATPDGMPMHLLVKTMKLLYDINQGRVASTDFMISLMKEKECEIRKNLYFYMGPKI